MDNKNSAVHHLALGACDVKRLSAFYRSAFDLKELKQHFNEEKKLRSIWLDLKPGILMIEQLQQTSCAERLSSLNSAPQHHAGLVEGGFFLLCFRIKQQERAAKEALLIGLGCEIESRSEYTSYLRDPEGNRVAVSWA